MAGPKNNTTVSWDLQGDWAKDPEAKVSIYLQQVQAETNKAKDVAKLVDAIGYDVRRAKVDLLRYRGKRYRIMIRKVGDAETGGHSQVFPLEEDIVEKGPREAPFGRF